MSDKQHKEKISLIAISFLALFLELSIIRWLPSNIFSLAYFSNIVLISSFLGLGVGFLLSKKNINIFRFFPLYLLFFVCIVLLLRIFETIVPDLKNEMMWSLYNNNQIVSGWIEIGIVPMLTLVFLLNTSLFAFVGEKTAQIMANFDPIRAYRLDIIGSILGIVFFSLLSFFGSSWSNPIIWFSLVCIISLWIIKSHRKYLILGIFSLVILLPVLYFNTKSEIWSPYYSIQKTDSENGSFDLYVNRFFFQGAKNFEKDEEALVKYQYPYKYIKPSNVLILGAGSGNDVAVASMSQVPEIDAVEIDPYIYQIGKEFHPNSPYANKNVTFFVDDARSYLKKTKKTYDMIVVGTLDSHALLSAKSTVRIDNFVYTQESLRSIKDHLSPRGVMVLMFSVPKDWLGQKIIKSVQNVFGSEATVVVTGNSYLFNLMVLAGPGVEKLISENPTTFISSKSIPENIMKTYNLSTDNWPYLYLREHTISSYYVESIIVLLLLILGFFVFLYKNSSQTVFNSDNLGFFLLGAGFLLLETKSITTLSLLFGSTWIVNSIVFGGILSMVLLSVIFVSKYRIRRTVWLHILLAISLVLNFVFPTGIFLGMSFWVKSLLSAFLVSLPIFFASLVFSERFKKVRDVSSAYGMNLLGAVFGGFLEYSSMITGLNFLYIIAIAIYVGVFLSFKNNDL
ncbi:MAG: hypothetical protein ABL917_02030 [Parcubacteria group bacterium]